MVARAPGRRNARRGRCPTSNAPPSGPYNRGMCGRYDLNQHPAVIGLEFLIDLERMSAFEPNPDVRPTDRAPIVRVAAGGGRECVLAKWDFTPKGSNAPHFSNGRPLINATVEKMRGRFWQPYFQHTRAIVPVASWYEWPEVGGRKVRHRVGVRGRELIGFAGLWTDWIGADGKPIEVYTIITTAANALVARLHSRERMPVILDPEQYAPWLDGRIEDPDAIRAPYPEERLYAEAA